jgi:hypothetical protein
MTRPFLAALAVLSVAVLSVGCSQQPSMDPALVAQHRTKLTLAEEPDGAQTVLDVRKVMLGEEESAEHTDEPAGEDAAATATANNETAEDAATEESDEPAEGEVVAEHDSAEHKEHADHAEGEEHADHDHAEGEEHAGHDHADHDPAKPKTPVVSEMDVVLVGKVGGVPNPSQQTHPEFPFAKHQALFFLSDPEAAAEFEEHQHEHAPGEECAFCSAHAADVAHLIAVVQFNDEQGEPLPVDARELFDLKEKETVVVRGKAKMTPSGMLIVDADGLYVRR